MGSFEVVDPRYRVLFDRAVAVLGADPRVREVRVGGSIGAGSADEWSDLDLQVITTPEGHAPFLAEWESWLAAVTPTVFARRPLAPNIVNSVTADGLTFDLAVYADEPPPFVTSGYAVGALARHSFATMRDALGYAVDEILRGTAGPFITFLRRGEHVRHLTGVPHIVGLLTTVFLAELDAPPPGKRLNDSLTDEQRAAIAALPPIRATYDDVAAFGLGVAELLVTRARPLYPRYDLTWPVDLAAVAASRLREHLGIDAPWLA